MLIGRKYITKGLPVRSERACPLAVYIAEQSSYATKGQCHAIDYDPATYSLVADHYASVDELTTARGLPFHWQGACEVIEIEA
jgi:hypothetical protein